jgi:major vault protein
MADPSVIRIKPYFYIHVLDNNSNTTRVETGPQTFTLQDHQKVVGGPDPMIMVPPRHYCIISNPVLKDEKGAVVKDSNGQIRLRHGDEEIRFEQEPFALYPGEKVIGKVTPLQVVAPDTALRLRAIRDFIDDESRSRKAGDEWLFEGPGTYIPRIEVQVAEVIRAVVIKPNQALKLRARKETNDRSGKKRQAGEEWLHRKTGSYLPGVDEEVIETVNAYILTDKKALHLRATRTFDDALGKTRKAGEEWLVTVDEAETHIPDVYEQVVGEVKITTLTNRQYAVVLDPWVKGKQLFGQKELRKGEASFFLNPGERLETGIQNVYVLTEEEALLLRAKENFFDEIDKKERKAGDKWMIYGPTDFVPPVEVEIIQKRTAIPLDENEGIYVRDIRTGRVRAVIGETYMLKPNEELWKKDLPKAVEDLLTKDRAEDDVTGERDKTKVISYRAPHNSAVQIYDYKEKKSRVVFGPDLVMLGPDEHFTVISLSGDHPKRPNVITAMALLLGPDFMTDVVVVETADHARLSLKLSYNWHFEIDRTNAAQAAKLFSVPDFVGDSCKAIASRVRGAVAGVSFDAFHKNSAKIICAAVFGTDDTGKIKNRLFFPSNNLVITNIDIQSVEPVDQRTRESLQKSVQLAIEITTKSQEASARDESTRLEQEAMGRLERQKITDQAEAEKARKELIQLNTESATIESTGQATAEAKARAEAANIEGQAAVKQAELSAEAAKIKSEAELEQMIDKQSAQLNYQKSINSLEINKAKDLSSIDASKFKNVVDAIGADTISAIAEAGPALQAKLLQGLGLQSFLITDGNNPINLFQTASGLINPPK